MCVFFAHTFIFRRNQSSRSNQVQLEVQRCPSSRILRVSRECVFFARTVICRRNQRSLEVINCNSKSSGVGADITKLPYVMFRSLVTGGFVGWNAAGLVGRQRGLVVRTRDFPNSSLALTTWLNSSAALVHSQLVCDQKNFI